jgi:hypothetical protein
MCPLYVGILGSCWLDRPINPALHTAILKCMYLTTNKLLHTLQGATKTLSIVGPCCFHNTRSIQAVPSTAFVRQNYIATAHV